ncbi:kinase-like protein [Phellopilus nigrolimitatus]|nr:kinase-like protein [Phellopilus nigrolimitatus]
MNAAAQAAKVVSACAPIPYLGPAVELLGAIIKLCQNVSKNRCITLLLFLVEKVNDSTNQGALEKIGAELTSVLKKIETQMAKWAKINYFKGFLVQEKISEEIKSYHSEIDQFYQRYTILFHKAELNWQAAHTAQAEADREGVMAFLVDFASTQELENRCHKGEINALKEDFNGFVELVQKLLLNSEQESRERRALENSFSAILRSSRVMPPGIELTEGLIQMPRDPVCGHGIFDIYRGTCFGSVQCALKVVRRMEIGPNTKQRFQRQHRHWKSVQTLDEGRHLLPLIGAIYRDYGSSPFLCLVTPWMEKGNAIQYVRQYEDTDRIALIRKIAEGVKVLHTHHPPLAHGYLKASNILINDFGDPLLADFGLLRVVEETMVEQISITSLPTASKSFRWLAPELLDDRLGFPLTTKSDVFMYGMTVLELMTSQEPFSYYKYDTIVLIKRNEGEKPKRPDGRLIKQRGLDDGLWELLNRCWAGNPDDRPSIQDILDSFPPLQQQQVFATF